ncbi:MAG: glucosaminidase domain-containing protein [Kiloniellaceae bacterium]
MVEGLRKPGLVALAAGALLAVFGFVVPAALAVVLTIDTGVLGPRRATDLLERFARRGYHLPAVAAGETGVPRMFLARLPRDWRGIAQADQRKRAFVMVMLPLVLQANERILADRARFLDLEAQRSIGKRLRARDRVWLEALAVSYKLSLKDRHELKNRLDIVPPSLAIAQAAIESGWGTSRFATQGNALFGQWTYEARNGMVPAARGAGQRHRIRRFGSLADSVASYMKNLNTHGAYRKFRARRAELRRRQALDGAALAATLGPYSERGRDYVQALRKLISRNALGRLDRVRLQAPTGGHHLLGRKGPGKQLSQAQPAGWGGVQRAASASRSSGAALQCVVSLIKFRGM